MIPTRQSKQGWDQNDTKTESPVTVAIELHLHLEGSLRPERISALAQQYGRPDVVRACLTDDGLALRPCRDFPDFLELFKATTSVLRTPADHHAVALDLGEALAEQGVKYAEVTVAYGVLQKRGFDPVPIQRALWEASDEIFGHHGLHLRWQPDATRQWGPDAAWRVLEDALRAGAGLGVVAFGLGGDEAALPVAEFAPHFREARRDGLGTTCHAGETGGPDSVRDAVLIAGVTRVGHGVGAAADQDVLRLLAETGVHVEMCPGSNVATGVLACREDHPMRAFLEAGISCNLNTDDPTFFNTTLADELSEAMRLLGLTKGEAKAMEVSALAASFAPDPVRQAVAALI